MLQVKQSSAKLETREEGILDAHGTSAQTEADTKKHAGPPTEMENKFNELTHKGENEG